MTSDEFWALIARINVKGTAQLDKADCSEQGLAHAAKALSGLEIKQIESFQEHLSKCLYDLDGKKYADHAGASGGSDDGFLYVRCWVVAQGRAHYEKVLNNPEKMPNNSEQWCEEIVYVALEAWGLKTGNDPMEWDFEPKLSYESSSNEDLWR